MWLENDSEEKNTVVCLSKKFLIPSRSVENNVRQPELLLRIQIKARKESIPKTDEKTVENEEISSDSPAESAEIEPTKSEPSKAEIAKAFTKASDFNIKMTNGKKLEIFQTPDLTVDAAENLFRYVDTREFRVQSVPVALNMLNVAEKLSMQDVVRRCSSFLLQNINESNVLRIYRHLKFSNESVNTDNFKNELLNKCLNIIDINAENIIKSKDFINLEMEVIKDIVSRSTLRIPSRAFIIEALKSWANRDCKCCLLLNHCSLLGKNARCIHSIVVRDAIETLNNNHNNCLVQTDESFREISSRGNPSPSVNPTKKLNRSKLRRSFSGIFWHLVKIFD